MTPLLMLGLCAVMVATSFLSGIFGMAGGLILIGVLLAILPVPDAMALHAITQMASNGWRAILWIKHVRWTPVGAFGLGCGTALALWSITQLVPSKPIALLFLGLTPFLVRLLPDRLRPNPESLLHGGAYGAACMALMLVTGVSGPLLDSYFLDGKLDRKQIVATKAMCQLMAHALKLAYFGGIIAQAAAIDPVMAGLAIVVSMLGTTLARRVLEALTEAQFRIWANRLITVIAGYYVAYGGYLLATQ